jgi:formylglycine-generating enzyme required for sulfatase activity
MTRQKIIKLVSCFLIVVLLCTLNLLGQTRPGEKSNSNNSNKPSNKNKNKNSNKSTSTRTGSSSSTKTKGATTEETAYWNEIKDSEDPTDFEGYLETYPKGFYARLAKAKLDEIKREQEKELWDSIKNSKDPKVFEDYLDNYPKGFYARQAKAKLDEINRKEIENWNLVKDSKDPKVFEDYLRDYPNGSHATQAKAKLAEIKPPLTTPPTTPEGPKRKFTNVAGIEFVYIPPGEFMMGSSDEEVKTLQDDLKRENPLAVLTQFDDEKPKHKVTIDYYFYMGKYEVTQEQWFKVMNTEKSSISPAPSYHRNCDDCPVETVSWDDVQEFIRKLNEQDSNYTYRLPTEAEWEYACRAGTKTFFAFGNSLTSKQANFDGEHPFGTEEKGIRNGNTTGFGNYKANDFGLYDMHGNVWEWCEDVYTNSYVGLPKDGSANKTIGDANIKVMRGGNYNQVGRSLRSAARAKNNAITRNQYIGFRLVAVPKTP